MNKYVKTFKEAIKQLNLKEREDYSKWDWKAIPPVKFTDDQIAAQKEFDDNVKHFESGLLSRKDLIVKLIRLMDRLPDHDYTRKPDAKLPDTLFPELENN